MTKPDDCELLELAAKAAELRVLPYLNAKNEWGHRNFEMYLVTEQGFPIRKWNPLVDDGDALRLVVKLRLSIDHNHPADQQRWTAADRSGCEGCYGPVSCVEDDFEDESDRSAATRRAIVRAAAEIGRSMK